MLNVTASWNQPCRSTAGATTLYLGVRIRAQPDSAPAGVCGVVVLDLSNSMAGAKLAAARQAVRQLWTELRTGDSLAIIGFGASSTVLLPWSQKGQLADSLLDEVLAACSTRGVTNLRAGLLEAIHLAVRSPPAVARFIWLVTDGDPTDAEGKRVTNFTPYLDDAVAGAISGISISAIGLGSAEHYSASFLRDLSDRGRGSFCYAATPDLLALQLQARLATAHRVVASSAQLELTLEPGNQLLAAARVVPEYVPLELSGGKGKWSVALGAIATPETVLLLEIATAGPFLGTAIVREVGELRVAADKNDPAGAAASVKLSLHYARPGSPELLTRDPVLEGLRYSMLLVRNEAMRLCAQTPAEKLRATEVMIDLVRRTGDAAVLQKLQAEAVQLSQNRALTADQEATLMQDIRATGRVAYQHLIDGRGTN